MLLLRRVLLSSAPSPRALLAKPHRLLRPPETLLPSPAARRIKAMASAALAMTREAFRAAVNNTLERRFFFVPSFKIYGGVAGLYDYGPPGCAVKANVLAFWRQVLPRRLRCGSYFRCLVCWFGGIRCRGGTFFFANSVLN
jgi:glycyl-tRNA synthetase